MKQWGREKGADFLAYALLDAVIDSYLSEAHVVGFDSQAICGVNGPGPFKIVNNYLEGSGENVMFGGADPRRSTSTAIGF